MKKSFEKCTLGLFKCSATAPLSFQTAFNVRTTGRSSMGTVTFCPPCGWTGARARDTAPPEGDRWLWSIARRFRYVWPHFLARRLISPVRLVQLCSVLQDFLTKQGGLMYWIGLSQISGTWTWVDNTVPKKWWIIIFKALTQQKIFQLSTVVNLHHPFCGAPQVLGRGGAAGRLCVSQD